MKRARNDEGGSAPEDGTYVEFASAVAYKIEPDALHRDLVSDARVFLNYALVLIEHISFELSDEGSQLAANPRDVSELLDGAAQHLKVSLAAMKESERRLPAGL